MFESDHSLPAAGKLTATSTRSRLARAMSCSARSMSTAACPGSTNAKPRSIEITARFPVRSKESRPASQPWTRGRLRVSRGSKPLQTSNQRAVSRTERDRQPTVTVKGGWWELGPFGIRPNVDFNPIRPVKPAGMRMDPPPSLPEARGRRPPATAAAEPPEEPPGVRCGSQGLCVVPWSLVCVKLTPPNSGAVVWPTGTAPASRSRVTCVLSQSDSRSRKTNEPSVEGQPSTASSSLIAIGTPPKGSDMSAAAAAARAASAST
jgi:hypothetical protein